MSDYTYKKDGVEYEKCIMCKKKLDVPKDLNIDLRENYVESVGQLCSKCVNKF